jgi:hypothetical protein
MITGLQTLLEYRLVDPSKIVAPYILTAAIQWMQGIEPDDGDISLKHSHYDYWKSLLDRRDHWGSLAQVTLRFFATSSSEAECEREISQMKNLIGSHRWSLSSSSLHALTHMIRHFSQ